MSGTGARCLAAVAYRWYLNLNATFPSPRLPRMTSARAILSMLLLATTLAGRHDRRVVDRIQIGDARSELDHAYEGKDVTSGVSGGRTFRQTRGWIRYALNVFDDNEVTVACTFLGNDNSARTFDLIVENHVVTTYTLRAYSDAATTVEFRVPFDITKGRTNILVTIRAAKGPTPALLELRTLQDHLE